MRKIGLGVGVLVVLGLAGAFAAAPPRVAPPDEPSVPARGASSEFPPEWFWGSGRVRQRQIELTGEPAPPLHVTGWRGEPVDLAKCRGKVVVVDFWGTWCGPCMASIPKNVELVRTYGPRDGEQDRNRDLVFVAIHDHARGTEKINETIKRFEINYPIAVDTEGGVTAKAYRVGFWPTYAVIDRRGIIRALGLQPQHVEAVVKKLLAEGGGDQEKKSG